MERISRLCLAPSTFILLYLLLVTVMAASPESFPRREGRSYALSDVDDFYTRLLDGSMEGYLAGNTVTIRPDDIAAATQREIRQERRDEDEGVVEGMSRREVSDGGSTQRGGTEDDRRENYVNPGVFPFRSFLERDPVPDNPLNRDVDDFFEQTPRNEHIDGRTTWLLITSFDDGIPGSGKVWAVPTHNVTLGFALIGGLQRPTGVCFDSNHDFLYVCDQGQGRVYQYEVDRNGGKKFELGSDVVATIVAEGTPTDCTTDSSGALFYTDLSTNSLYTVPYPDLWSGYISRSQLLTSDLTEISAPTAIDVYQSTMIYYVNNANSGDVGLLKEVDRESGRVFRDLVREDKTAWGVAVSRKGAYFSVEDGSVWMYTFSTPNLLLKTSMTLFTPRGLCYGSGFLYVVDSKTGIISRFSDSYIEEEPLINLFRVANGYWIECVNG